MDTVLVGTIVSTRSLAITHAVEMEKNKDGKCGVIRMCNNNLPVNLPDVTVQDKIKLSSITCKNCYHALKKKMRVGKVIRNFTNSASDFKYPVYDGNDIKLMKETILASKKDDRCEACFAENEDECYGCDAHTGYPNFVTEEKYKGTTEKTKEESTCGECTNLDLETFIWPCNSCNISNNFKYFSKNKGRLCTTCRYNPNCNRECDSNYSHWKPIEPKNGLVELLPFGIKKEVIFQHPDFKGRHWDNLVTATLDIRFEKMTELLTTLSEFEPESYYDDYADVVEKILDTLATNIVNNPTKHIELFKEILE